MLTRTERTWEIRNTINKQWSLYYFKFIQDNIGKNWDWSSISKNPNISYNKFRKRKETISK
jgi:hypothetical protein